MEHGIDWHNVWHSHKIELNAENWIQNKTNLWQ